MLVRQINDTWKGMVEFTVSILVVHFVVPSSVCIHDFIIVLLKVAKLPQLQQVLAGDSTNSINETRTIKKIHSHSLPTDIDFHIQARYPVMS